MKQGKLKSAGLLFLAIILISTLAAVFCLTEKTVAFAESYGYDESYRNRLAYSAKEGWNNDPNGLLYVNGTYHMYYQYTWKDGQTKPWWDDMSWGHATSEDLVHWVEKPVAIPAYQNVDGKYYGMMFSGSAVYDEYNTSGLFETENGKVKDGQGIVAILTQPNDEEGGQRQILAYSCDDGETFTIYGEILGANAEGSLGDGEFRDPKVFWTEKLEKWLMVVGGGAVRMYSSDNLKDWKYLGQTGFWGECPDLSRYTADGGEKYVLILSPEDKEQSHRYNGTTRSDVYYPAEYYVVGNLDENGLFRATQSLKRLSEGIDSYAFQSFNNTPDGKVYGVSWAASWKSVGEYQSYRKNYNGGMTAVCELGLVKEGNEYVVTRTPVEGFKSLRGNAVFTYNDRLPAGENALKDAFADVADIELSLDFTNSAATCAELSLRVSAAERITVKYDAAAQTLTLDRSQSSLLASNTALYKIPYSKTVPLEDGKLYLRILLDRAFISVFANDGKASYFSAVFPSAVSAGMELISDGEIGVRAVVYAVCGIFGDVKTADELQVTAQKIDTTVGSSEFIIASSFASGFKADNVKFAVKSGDCISLTQDGAIATVTPQNTGVATVTATYRKQTKEIEIYVYENGFKSDVDFGIRQGGYSYIRDDGLFFATGESDAFMFGSAAGSDFKYTATFNPVKADSQAGGLAFGVSDNLTHYFVATADIKDNRVKFWEAGVGDLFTVPYAFESGKSVKLTLAVCLGTVKIYVNDDNSPAIIYKISNYNGGGVGLNVYNAEMSVNDVEFTPLAYENGYGIGSEQIVKVLNVTDSSRLSESEYSVTDGKLVLTESYLNSLTPDTLYTFRAFTSVGEYEFTVKTNSTSLTFAPDKEAFNADEDVLFTLSDGTAVSKIEIDGVEIADGGFTVDGTKITISKDALKGLVKGEHEVKAYTANGRLTASFNFLGVEDFREEEVGEESHAFFWVDVALFASLIIGYLSFTIFKKSAKRRGVKNEK